MTFDPRPLSPGDPVPDGSWFRALRDEVRRRSKFRALPPLTYTRSAGGIFVALNEVRPFYARLTGGPTSAGAYSWQEVRHTGGSTWATVTGGRSGTSNAYEENNAADVPVPSVVRIRPSVVGDWRFVWLRSGQGILGPPCTGGTICVSVPACFDMTGVVLVTIHDPNGATVCTGPTDSNGRFCCTPPSGSIEGTWSATFAWGSGASCSNYDLPPTQTFTWTCKYGASVGYALPCKAAAWDSGSYIVNPCGGSCAPCNGRPSFVIPKTLHITITGPVPVFGTLGSVPLTLAGDSDAFAFCDTGAQAQVGHYLHWSSGCLANPGSYGACYYSGECVIGGQPFAVTKRVPGSQVLYGSAQIDVYQHYFYPDSLGQVCCYVEVQFNNYWNAGCSNAGVSCAAGQTLHPYPCYEVACAGSVFFGDDGNPYTPMYYPQNADFPITVPDGNASTGGLGSACSQGGNCASFGTPGNLPGACLTGPVNFSVSNIPLNSNGFASRDSGGALITWGCTLTE